MGSLWRSMFKDPNPGSIGTANNNGSSLEFQATSSSAGKNQCSDVEEENPMAQMCRTPSLKQFSFEDLRIVANNFRDDRYLGGGSSGTVYKGWVDEETLAPSRRKIGMPVASKIIKPQSLGGFEEWQFFSKEHVEAMEEKPKNSKLSSPASTAHQPCSHHRS